MQPKTKEPQKQMELFKRELEELVNPGHALVKLGRLIDWTVFEEKLGQTRRVTKDRVKEAHVDMGYRGHGHKGKETSHVDRRRRGNTGRKLWKRMKHRAAVEPTTGHCKTEHRMERNRLRAQAGDAVNALPSAASMTFGKLRAAFLRFFIRLPLGINPSPTPLCLSHGA